MSSRRQYLSQAELEEYADIDIIDHTEADDQISQAEEMIDAYVGPQDRFLSQDREVFGIATAATSTTIVDSSSDSPLDTTQDNYFTYCEVEIISGTGSGQRRTIASSSGTSNSITVSSAWSTNPSTDSAYRIYQLGKFPRCSDTFFDPDNQKYHKAIPEAIRRAVAAQVEFVISMGTSFFSGQSANMKSETISDYSYTTNDSNSVGSSALLRLIAPKARTYLRGITNRKGRILY